MNAWIVSYWQDKSGSIALLFGLLLPIVLGFIGLGFDATRAHFVKQRLHSAVDAAVIAAAASRGTDVERRQIGEAVFAANYGTGLFSPPADITLTFDADGDVDLSVDTQMSAPFASFAGMDVLDIHVESAANRPILDIEIVLVVDVSGSMYASNSGGMSRIEALRQAAQKLLETLRDSAPSNVQLRFAIVPYNVNVNIGTANAHVVSDTGNALFTGTSWAGCVMERRPPFHLSNEYNPLATNGSGKWPAYIWPPEPDTLSNGLQSCLNPSNGGNNGYMIVEESLGVSNVMTQGPNLNCTRQPILPLTENLETVETAIAGLQAASNYGTLIAPGVTWGLRVLTPSEPFADAAPFSPAAQKFMVVLTDGEQINDTQLPNCRNVNHSSQTHSFDPASMDLAGNPITGHGPSDIWTPYGYILDSNPLGKAPDDFVSQADELLVEACDAAKLAGMSGGGELQIFTVTFSADAGPSTSVSDAMRNCASSSDQYFHATNAQKLEDAFEEIGQLVGTVSLVR